LAEKIDLNEMTIVNREAKVFGDVWISWGKGCHNTQTEGSLSSRLIPRHRAETKGRKSFLAGRTVSGSIHCCKRASSLTET